MKNLSQAYFRPFFSVLLIAAIFSCDKKEEITFTESTQEKYRPDYHFTPPFGWMNDPNGLVYQDGVYHLFYQYYPDSTVWGPMHWGHATSQDLVSWNHENIGLYPDSLGYIFSGSAVFDAENSSGLGTTENPPLVAIFTYHDMESERAGNDDYQSQGIAFSTDKGKTWTKYDGNPVLPNQGIRDFRDPKVSRITNVNGEMVWLMTLAVKDRIQFYESSDLKNWNLLSEFGQTIGAHGGVWECPDLIPMTAPNGDKKWILFVSINPGGPQKGSATQYFIGDFDGKTFSPDEEQEQWIDWGTDNYAGVTWSNLPENRTNPLFIGWMSNWQYAQVVPTKSWRSAMTIPRELELFEANGRLKLKSIPAPELKSLRSAPIQAHDGILPLPSQSFEFQAEISNSTDFGFEVTNEKGEKLALSKNGDEFSIDRTPSGITDFNDAFGKKISAKMDWEAKSIRVFFDAHSAEVFINDGELTMTVISFPSIPWKNIENLHGLDKSEVFDIKNK